jgi:hypothetical protein
MAWLLAIIFGFFAAQSLYSEDPMGGLLFGIAAVALTAVALHGTVIRPRLTANSQGIRLRSLNGSTELAWDQLRCGVHVHRRLARETATLELEHGDSIFVFGWLELGQDPREVLADLEKLKGSR